MISVFFSLGGCFLLRSSGSSDTKRKERTLLNYLENDENVVSARVWTKQNDEKELVVIEVPEDQLEGLLEEMKKTPIKSHFGVADYFYGGWYGIELTLSDGTYLTYDCTCLEHRKAPYDAEYDPDDKIKKDYIEDKGRDFWDRIEKYVPGMNAEDFSYGW
jgi:hypothetical protein